MVEREPDESAALSITIDAAEIPPTGPWVEEGISSTLCWLAIDDWKDMLLVTFAVPERKLGLNIQHESLEVSRINAGPVAAWNAVTSGRRVKTGNQIVEVNGRKLTSFSELIGIAKVDGVRSIQFSQRVAAGGAGRRASLPPLLYGFAIAPFLRFDEPEPNQLYALGGRNQQEGALDAVEMFDTWHGRWVRCPRMAVRRAGCAAALLPDGQLFAVGGYDERGIVDGLLSSCEAFDAAAQWWDPDRAALRRPRWGHGCASLGGLVYAVGGCSLEQGAPQTDEHMETLRSCEVYDPEVDRWSPCADLRVARAGARVVALGGGHLAAVGGCDDVFGRAETLPTVEVFDAAVGVWALLELRLSTPRTTAGVASLGDRRLLVIGGAPSLSSAEVYSVPQEAGCEAAGAAPRQVAGVLSPAVCDMAEGRMGCQAVTLNLPAPGDEFPLCKRPCVVVVGGENVEETEGGSIDEGQAREFSSVLVYDAEDGAWRSEASFPPMPAPRTAMALVVGPGRVDGYRN